MNNIIPKDLQRLFINNVLASSTFDNIKAKFKIKHKPIGDLIPYDNNNKSMTKCEVFNNIGNANVSVRSSEDGETLTIDGSFIKWLTGQNVIGSTDLLYLCLQLFLRVCKSLNLSPTQQEIDAVKTGKFILLRVDYAVHCDAGDEETVIFLQRQIKKHWAFKVRNYSHYEHYETLYIGQHSKRRTFKTYMKGREIKVKGELDGVLYGKHIENLSKRLLRIESTWRNKGLREITSKTYPELFLRQPLAWKGKCARKLMKERMSELLGGITELTVSSNKSLTNAQNIALAAHKAGVSVEDVCGKRSFDGLRKKIEDKTNINISLPASKRNIGKGLLKAQKLITDRIKHKSHRKLVKQMMAHVDSFVPNQTSDISGLMG